MHVRFLTGCIAAAAFAALSLPVLAQSSSSTSSGPSSSTSDSPTTGISDTTRSGASPSTTGATDAATFCGSGDLSSSDRASCQDEMRKANTTAKQDQVRRKYQARMTNATGTPGATTGAYRPGGSSSGSSSRSPSRSATPQPK